MITDEQKRNLATLGKFLAEQVKYDAARHAYYFQDSRFNMDRYCNYTGVEQRERQYKDCGTAGCAVGFGPYAGIEKGDECFREYCKRCFVPYENAEGVVIEPYKIWQFMFSPDWSNYNNTPLGAAQRIAWFLSGKEIPEDVFHGDYSKADLTIFNIILTPTI